MDFVVSLACDRHQIASKIRHIGKLKLEGELSLAFQGHGPAGLPFVGMNYGRNLFPIVISGTTLPSSRRGSLSVVGGTSVEKATCERRGGS